MERGAALHNSHLIHLSLKRSAVKIVLKGGERVSCHFVILLGPQFKSGLASINKKEPVK